MKMSSSRVIKSEDVQYRIPCEPVSVAANSEERWVASASPSDSSPQERMKEGISETLKEAVHKSYEKGLAEGIKMGREQQRQENLQLLSSMNQAIKEVAQLRGKIFADLEHQIVTLSLAIAEKVLHGEVTTNDEVIQNVLKDAIRNIVDRDNMKVRLHPLDFRTMMAIKADFLQSFDGIKNIRFEEDVSLQRGGAVIETLFGEVDARMEQQFLEVKAAITNQAVGG